MTADRYAPDVSLPAYAFVPGRNPHPITDPLGHSFGKPHVVPEPLDPERPNASCEFLTAIDLFNAGFYWEAHEAWESLWIAAGRSGIVADFLKGLIKLAAAGVKAREGQPVGVVRHSRRAVELFESVRSKQFDRPLLYAGLSLDQLIQDAGSLAADPNVDATPSVGGLPVVSFRLVMASDSVTGPSNRQAAER